MELTAGDMIASLEGAITRIKIAQAKHNSKWRNLLAQKKLKQKLEQCEKRIAHYRQFMPDEPVIPNKLDSDLITNT